MKLAWTNHGSASSRRVNQSTSDSTMNAVSVCSAENRAGAHHSLCSSTPGCARSGRYSSHGSAGTSTPFAASHRAHSNGPSASDGSFTPMSKPGSTPS